MHTRRLVYMCSWHSYVNGSYYTSNTSFDLSCPTCTIRVEIWEMNILIMSLHFGLSILSLILTLLLAGFKITLMLSCLLKTVSTSVKSYIDCIIWGMMQRYLSKIGINIVFGIGSIEFPVHLTRTSSLFSRSYDEFFFSLICFFRVEIWRCLCK